MGKQQTTAAEKRYYDRAAALGCLVCQKPTQLHHIRTERIKDNMLVIPLCQEHHTGGFSNHMTPDTFQNIYGSELQMLADTNRALA